MAGTGWSQESRQLRLRSRAESLAAGIAAEFEAGGGQRGQGRLGEVQSRQKGGAGPDGYMQSTGALGVTLRV